MVVRGGYARANDYQFINGTSTYVTSWNTTTCPSPASCQPITEKLLVEPFGRYPNNTIPGPVNNNITLQVVFRKYNISFDTKYSISGWTHICKCPFNHSNIGSFLNKDLYN
jgi:hypothetical protein